MSGAVPRALAKLRREAARAGRDTFRVWRPWSWTFPLGYALAASAPLVFGPLRLATFASGLLVALAAVGLNVAMGLGGMPSLAQGAFAGLGAFGAAVLRVKVGWDPVGAWAAGVGVAAAAGVVVGAGAIRLRGATVAVATWVVTWLVGFALVAFPGLTGGSRGLVVAEAAFRVPVAGTFLRFTPGVEYELALALLAGALLASWSLCRGAPGLALALVRRAPEAAAAVGISGHRLRLGTFTASAAIAGASGALAVQVAGVADPAAYGPLYSIELFVAVLLGGEGTVLGPVVGAAALAGISPAARAVGDVAGVAAERFESVIAAGLLVAALVAGRGGLVRRIGRARPGEARPGQRASAGPPAPVAPGSAPAPTRSGPSPTLLAVEGATKRFGGVVALDRVDLDLEEGEIHALIGPNGSGKTTLLRVLGGVVASDGGRVRFDGHDILGWSPQARAAAGLVRTLPRTVVVPEVTVLDHVLAGATVRRRYGGAARTIFATPRARTETERVRASARRVLSLFGLDDVAGVLVDRLPGTERRLVMIATASASRPRVLLLDEPSSGMSPPEAHHLAAVLTGLRARGTTLLVVEHNMRIVRSVADRVTVLDAGRVIARGSPDAVARDPAVVEAYLGPKGL